MHSDVAVATILILQGTRATKEYLAAEAAAGTLHPGDHDCGLPTTTNVAWD
jgi:hypothetical protein